MIYLFFTNLFLSSNFVLSIGQRLACLAQFWQSVWPQGIITGVWNTPWHNGHISWGFGWFTNRSTLSDISVKWKKHRSRRILKMKKKIEQENKGNLNLLIRKKCYDFKTSRTKHYTMLFGLVFNIHEYQLSLVRNTDQI